jgi:ATP phosphoribosyltransferase regulatory subunit
VASEDFSADPDAATGRSSTKIRRLPVAKSNTMTDRTPATFSEQGDTSTSRANFYASGTRDLLPLDVAQKRWVERGLQDVFQRWGYHRIITSTLERLETLMAGGAVDRDTVIQFPDAEGGTLGLRPELTASIARAAVTRMGDMYPQRLYYNANIFRRADLEHHGRQQEFYQAGIELLGASGTLADAEAISIVADCLRALGVPNWQLILGEAGLSRALLAQFPIEFQTQIRRCLAHLDRVTLAQLPLSESQRHLALSLIDLRGNPDRVLTKLAALELDDRCQATISDLQALVDLLTASSEQPLPLVLDLSLIQTFDYYTGIVFEAVSATADRACVLGQGGRYDRLLGLYHPQGQDCPGIGFSLDLEALQQMLQTHPLMPQTTPKPDWLVVAIAPTAAAAALRYGQKLRATPDRARVEIYLNDTPLDRIRSIASERGIAQIAWVSEDDVIVEGLGIRD